MLLTLGVPFCGIYKLPSSTVGGGSGGVTVLLALALPMASFLYDLIALSP